MVKNLPAASLQHSVLQEAPFGKLPSEHDLSMLNLRCAVPGAHDFDQARLFSSKSKGHGRCQSASAAHFAHRVSPEKLKRN